MHVAPAGIYDLSAVLESPARGALDRMTQSFTGSLSFSAVDGGTIIESDCGDSPSGSFLTTGDGIIKGPGTPKYGGRPKIGEHEA